MRVFGLDPRRDEVAVKSRIAYVPDQIGVTLLETGLQFYMHAARTALAC